MSKTYNPDMIPFDLKSLSSLPGARSALFPGKMEPMQPTLIPRPFSNPDWMFEPKIDGFRGIARIEDNVRIISRRGADLTRYFKEVASELEGIGHQTVLDGEIVAIAGDGKPCFECLQQRIGMKSEGPKGRVPWPYAIVYFVFDIMYLDGYDLTGVPLIERKKVLSGLVSSTASFQLVDYFENDGELLFKIAVERGFEGVVAKRKDSIYEPGRRTETWLKAKASVTEEFFIGGYVTSSKTGSLSSLVVGQHDGGRLKFKGNVGTMGNKAKVELIRRLPTLKIDVSPFDEDLRLEETPVWVEPQILVEVKFTSWTHGGYMREPALVRIAP